MKKIIGEKKKFAIQYEVVEVINQYIYGYICYWINGIQIGDFTSITIISDVFVSLPQIVKDNGNREHEKVFKMEKGLVDKVFLGFYKEFDVFYEDHI